MSQPTTIPVAQLSRLADLTEGRLRDLSTEGWLPKPVDGSYQLVPASQGLLRYYRQRDPERILQDAYDSIGACASATKIPVTALKHGKRQGCRAFRGSPGVCRAVPGLVLPMPWRFQGQL